ncbi:MAG: BrnT family toxin [Desulfobaccales bacterium]
MARFVQSIDNESECIYIADVRFEWDDDKRRENLRKHGVDFREAAEMFSGPMLVRADSREYYGEDRYIGYGLVKGMLMVVVFTEPDDGTVRVISLRKAKQNEKRHFAAKVRD